MMRALLNILLLITASFFVVSCEKDIVVNTPPSPQRVVVEGWIYTDETPIVLLSKTYPAFGTVNLLSLLDSLYLRGATVNVYHNGIAYPLQEVTLSELPADQQAQVAELFEIPPQFAFILADFPVYTDVTGTLKGQINGVYDLEVFFEDDVLTATTVIPEKTGVDSLTYTINQDIDTMATVFVNITVPASTDRFVRYANRRNQNPFFFPRTTGSTFDSGRFAGQSFKLPMERGYGRDEDVDIREFGMFVVGDTVTLRWMNISRATYDFWFTIENDGGDSPFSSPIQIKSNINGGLGIWGGYAVSFYTIIIE
jgi:hypothetical protein